MQIDREIVLLVAEKVGFDTVEGMHPLVVFAQEIAKLAVEAERDACAKAFADWAMKLEEKADAEKCYWKDASTLRASAWFIKLCADAIRARGMTKEI